MELPPPEQRLCKKHGKPIKPSQWRKRCRNSGCSWCGNERNRSPEARKRREEKWEKKLIFCANHPDRRCSKSAYVCRGRRRCGSCDHKLSSGELRPRSKRNLSKKDYKKIVAKRTKYLSNGTRGIELFNRSIGYNLISPTGAIQL